MNFLMDTCGRSFYYLHHYQVSQNGEKKTYEKFNLHLQINKIILININQVLVEKTVTIYQFFVHWLLHHITIIRFPTTFQEKT